MNKGQLLVLLTPYSDDCDVSLIVRTQDGDTFENDYAFFQKLEVAFNSEDEGGAFELTLICTP